MVTRECVAPEKRRPLTTDSTPRREIDINGGTNGKCPVCFENLLGRLCVPFPADLKEDKGQKYAFWGDFVFSGAK
jgi:hypothetical protein